MSSSDSKMERLRKRLYSQDQPDSETNEADLSKPDKADTPGDWRHDHKRTKHSHGWLNKFLVFAGIFCLLAAGFAAATIWLGDTGMSSNQVDISVSGPSTISAGQTTELTISVSNNNEVPLEDVSLTTMFPPGTRQPDTSGDELRRIRKQLDTLAPGETRNVSVSASLFGQQDQTRTVDVELNYRVPESNAIFSANSQYAINIGELPVSIAIESPDQTAPGQPVNFQVNVQSNSAKTLSDVILRANYPFGFSASDVSPVPRYRDYVWSLGDLKPGGSRQINISGRFADSVSSGKSAFTFSAGIESSQSSTTIGTLFADREAVLSLREPYIDVTLDLQQESQSQPVVLSPGQSINGNLRYQSNLDTQVSGADFDLEFIGDGIDISSIDSEIGLFREPKATINWNPRTNNSLQSIESGESGSLRFKFTNKTTENLIGITNPTAEMKATLNADSPQGSDLPQTVSVEVVRSPRLHSGVSVETASLHDNGPFETSGPMPPKVGEATDYTAHFTVRNTTNNLRDVNLQAAVPAFVQVSGKPQVSTGDFSFNDVTGRLKWSISELAAGSGYENPPAEIFIPLQITPSNSEQGEASKLLRDVILTSQDQFAEQRLEVDSIKEPTTIPSSADDNDTNVGSVQPRDD